MAAGKRGADGKYKHPPMKPPPAWVALTSAHLNFGGAAGMAYGLRSFEFDTVAQVARHSAGTRGSQTHRWPAH